MEMHHERKQTTDTTAINMEIVYFVRVRKKSVHTKYYNLMCNNLSRIQTRHHKIIKLYAITYLIY